MSDLYAYAEAPRFADATPDALPLRVTLPIVLLLSLTLWMMLWKAANWAFGLVAGWPG